jgi:hypothetical protein
MTHVLVPIYTNLRIVQHFHLLTMKTWIYTTKLLIFQHVVWEINQLHFNMLEHFKICRNRWIVEHKKLFYHEKKTFISIANRWNLKHPWSTFAICTWTLFPYAITSCIILFVFSSYYVIGWQSCKVKPWQCVITVRDDPKLPDDSEGVPKIEWSGWQFDSQLWNLLSIWRKN